MNQKLIEPHADTFEQDLAKEINLASRRRKENKNKANCVVLGGAILSAVTTLLIALPSLFPEQFANWFQGFALLFSVALTVLNAWDGLFDHRRLWINQAELQTRLEQIQRDLKNLIEQDKVQSDLLCRLYVEFKTALTSYHQQWLEMRSEEDLPNSKPE